MRKISIYYSVPDHFPSFRVDVSELFGISLQKEGLQTEWFMANHDHEALPSEQSFYGQKCIIPPRVPGRNKLARMLTKLIYYATDSLCMIRAAFSHYDILQTRDKYLVSLIALFLSKLTGKTFVYWCSYPFPEHALELARAQSGWLKPLWILRAKCLHFLLYRLVMRYADHSFVQSEQMLKDIASYGVAVSNMTPVPMGVAPHMLDWKNQHAVSVVTGKVAYLGTMASVRRLSVLIEAFKIVHDHCPWATLLMVGDGDKKHEREQLEKQAADLGLSSVITFTGFVPIEQAWTQAASAAVCLSPFYPTKILASASPTKLVEYMALGRPVVCNDHPEQSKIIAENEAGIVVPWSSKSFAQAVINLLNHPEQAEVMGNRGPAWVAQSRTYPIIAEVVWMKYCFLIKKPASTVSFK